MDIPENPIEAYLADYRKLRNPAENTVVNKKSTLSRYFAWLNKKGFEWHRVNESILLDYAGNLPGRGSSRRETWKRLRHFYEWAQRKGFIKANPAPKMYSPPKSAPRAPRKGFDANEVEALLDALPLYGDVQRFFVVYMLSRPVRLSEIIKLRVCDIDLKSKRIYIGFDPTDPDPAKTEGSCRYQSIPERALPILRRLMHDKALDESLLGITAEWARQLILDIFKKAGIEPEGRGSHAFRHTVIMRLTFEKRIDPAIVAEMAGNSPVTIYRDYLNDIPMTRLERAMKDAENF